MRVSSLPANGPKPCWMESARSAPWKTSIWVTTLTWHPAPRHLPTPTKMVVHASRAFEYSRHNFRDHQHDMIFEHQRLNTCINYVARYCKTFNLCDVLVPDILRMRMTHYPVAVTHANKYHEFTIRSLAYECVFYLRSP